MNVKQTKEGWWIIEGDTHLGKWIEESGELAHDKFLIPIACNNFPEGATVMDIGAMYGDHTIAYCKKVGMEGLVFAIEAGQLAYKCLLNNAKRFEGPLLCINAACCGQHGGKAIHQVQEGNLGMSIVTEDESKGVEIPTISIDGLVKDAVLKHLHFVKIDAEGWEYKILTGALGTLRTLKPILLIEINAYALSQQGDSDRDIYDLLVEENYGWKIVQPGVKGGDPMFDIMAYPNKIEVETPKIIV